MLTYLLYSYHASTTINYIHCHVNWYIFYNKFVTKTGQINMVQILHSYHASITKIYKILSLINASNHSWIDFFPSLSFLIENLA